MDPIIARPIIYIVSVLLVMAFLSLPFVEPESPEQYIDIISIIVLLIILIIIGYDIRKQVRKSMYDHGFP